MRVAVHSPLLYHFVDILTDGNSGCASSGDGVPPAAGAADKNYGIYVAKLAGVPSSVVQRSQEILTDLEANHSTNQSPTRKEGTSARGGHKLAVGTVQFSLFGAESHPVVVELQDGGVDELKSMEALQV